MKSQYTPLATFLAFIAINFVFGLIANILNGVDLIYSITDHYTLIKTLFNGIRMLFIDLWFDFAYNIAYFSSLESLIPLIGYTLAPIISAIIAGKYGENRKEALKSWAITLLVSCIFVIYVIRYDNRRAISLNPLYYDIIGLITIGAFNFFFYGLIVYFLCRKEKYFTEASDLKE